MMRPPATIRRFRLYVKLLMGRNTSLLRKRSLVFERGCGPTHVRAVQTFSNLFQKSRRNAIGVWNSSALGVCSALERLSVRFITNRAVTPFRREVLGGGAVGASRINRGNTPAGSVIAGGARW